MDRLDLARVARKGVPREADPGRRRRRRHLEPDDLPEGAGGRLLVRRAAQAGARRGRGAEGDLLPARGQGHPGRVRRPSTRLGRGRRQGRLRLDGGRPDARLRPRRDDRGGHASARMDRPAQPAREDPRHRARPRRDRGVHRPRSLDQRDADLLARPLRRRRRGVHPRARAARRVGRRPPHRSPPSRASSSRASTPRPTDDSTRPAGPSSRASSRSRTRSSPTSATRSSSRGRAGRRSRRRVRHRSAACGRPRRRRTRSTAT